MHGFRDRPLTWLFLAAMICVDLLMILPVMFPSQSIDDYLSRWIVSNGVPAQLSLVAVWAATSGGYRLVRGAVLTAAVYAALFSALLFGLPRQEVAPYLLTPVLAIWSVALGMRLLGLLPGWSPCDTIDRTAGSDTVDQSMSAVDVQDGDETSEPLDPWQFSVIELFGWTCVVALWAFAMHQANLAPYGWIWLAWFAGVVVDPLLMVVLLGGSGSWWVRSSYVGLVIALVLLAHRSVGNPQSVIGLISAAYLMLWYVVRRLDGALASSSEGRA